MDTTSLFHGFRFPSIADPIHRTILVGMINGVDFVGWYGTKRRGVNWTWHMLTTNMVDRHWP